MKASNITEVTRLPRVYGRLYTPASVMMTQESVRALAVLSPQGIETTGMVNVGECMCV
jgi:hypothetical protein